MMRRPLIGMLLAGVLLLGSSSASLAWSSSASRTEGRIAMLSVALNGYRAKFGQLPPPQEYWRELQRAGMLWESPRSGPPLDDWGRPLVYRMPGRHDDFDLFSCGPDGIDQDGGLDDVSNWAGVNDGFHWKSTWPAGRTIIGCSVVLGLGCLLLARFFSLRIIAPLSGAMVCLGIVLGCRMLMHPGIVPSRNGPLAVCSAVAFCLGAVLLTIVTVNVRKGA